MGAITSKYQETPWEPNVDPSSKDKDNQQEAADKYTEVYGGSPTHDPDSTDTSNDGIATMPTLSMAYTTAPEFVPSTPSGPDGGPPPLPDYKPFTIHLGSLRSNEQLMLNSLAIVTQHYEDLQARVAGVISADTLFGQNDGYWASDASAFAGAGDTPVVSSGTYWYPNTDFNDEGRKFADSMSEHMTTALRNAAGAIAGLGTFVAMLNNAGQQYTAADASSAFPSP